MPASDSGAGLFETRLTRLRAALRQAHLDAFVVTHLPNLRYLTGLAASAGALVVTTDACRLGVDFRYQTAAEQALARLSPGTIALDVVEASLDEWMVPLLIASRAARVGVEGASMPVARFNRLSASLAAAAPLPFEGQGGSPSLVATERVLEALRTVKDDEEAATLREAARRLSEVARRLPELARPGKSEREVAADIDLSLRLAGFERPAFETIVASGPNGALPHARPGGRILAPGDGVVLDFGGVYDGYCVDLTRTVLLGQPPPELRRMFAAVAEAREAALQAVAPGRMPSAIDDAARRVLAAHGLGEAFGHATGHGLGLEVHEEPRIGRRLAGREEFPIEPGMVFTIEPGAYVPGVGGVRIEDDILVTPDGYELLTRVPVDMDAPQAH